MRYFFFFMAAGLALSLQALSKDITVKSPDERLVLTVSVNSDVRWTLEYDGKRLVDPSVISMTIDDRQMPGTDPLMKKAKVTDINSELRPVVPHKNSIIKDRCRELLIPFGQGCSLLFRVYNDGMAYRFVTSLKGEVRIDSETFSMALPEGSTAWYPLETSFMSHNERNYLATAVDTLGPKHLASLPVLFSTGGVNILLSESDLEDYPGMWVTGDGQGGITGVFPAYPAREKATNDRNVFITEREKFLAKTNGSRSFPWRVLIVSPDDKGLAESDMIYKLAAPQRIDDASWIRPGKVAWDWFNANNLYGVDFKAGLNTETYKYYIDFASENHIEYVILDEGWYNLGDVLSVADGFDIKEICDYAAAKNVGIILWVVWKSFYDKIDEALGQFERWGVKGIKVDFMQRDDQWMVNYYHLVAQKAAEHKMIVDFHGAYKPVGMERTWPNVLTSEGVKGLENNKWSTSVDPDHDLMLPFTRMAAGPMDYTPGAMRNMQKRDFKPVFYRPSSQGTRVHQMAMYVVYESPLMMLADSPSNYIREKDCTRFISMIPVTWDETRVLAAKTGDYIVIARRNGMTWYLAAMTDWTERKIEVDLSFLGDMEYFYSYFADGVNAGTFGEDYIMNTRSVMEDRKITISMAPGGGWVGMFYLSEIASGL